MLDYVSVIQAILMMALSNAKFVVQLVKTHQIFAHLAKLATLDFLISIHASVNMDFWI